MSIIKIEHFLSHIVFLSVFSCLKTSDPSHADSSFVPPLIYSVLGSSRHLAVGPVSIASLVMGTMLREAVSDIDHPDLYLKLAFTSTFFAGLFQASLGFLRLILARVMICALILNLCLSIAQLSDLHLSQQFLRFSYKNDDFVH